jgi:hypothetical protein
VTRLYFTALLKRSFHKTPSFKTIRDRKRAKKINISVLQDARYGVELLEGGFLSVEGQFFDLYIFLWSDDFVYSHLLCHTESSLKVNSKEQQSKRWHVWEGKYIYRRHSNVFCKYVV